MRKVRCGECGSWDRECSADSPVPGCCCVRCAAAEIGTLRSDLAREREAHAATVTLLRQGEALREGMPAQIAILEAGLAAERAVREQAERERDEARTTLEFVRASRAQADQDGTTDLAARIAAEARAAGLEAALRAAVRLLRTETGLDVSGLEAALSDPAAALVGTRKP